MSGRIFLPTKGPFLSLCKFAAIQRWTINRQASCGVVSQWLEEEEDRYICLVTTTRKLMQESQATNMTWRQVSEGLEASKLWVLGVFLLLCQWNGDRFSFCSGLFLCKSIHNCHRHWLKPPWQLCILCVFTNVYVCKPRLSNTKSPFSSTHIPKKNLKVIEC